MLILRNIYHSSFSIRKSSEVNVKAWYEHTMHFQVWTVVACLFVAALPSHHLSVRQYRNNNVDICKELLAKGADVDLSDING